MPPCTPRPEAPKGHLSVPGEVHQALIAHTVDQPIADPIPRVPPPCPSMNRASDEVRNEAHGARKEGQEERVPRKDLVAERVKQDPPPCSRGSRQTAAPCSAGETASDSEISEG